MKTKHYLIISGAVVIGIIIGVLISTTVFRKQHFKMRQYRTEIQMDENDFGRNHKKRQGDNYRGMQIGNKKGMGRTENRSMIRENIISQLDLSDEQNVQMDELFSEIEKERDQIQNVRESRWAATQVEIKSVLNPDQIEKMEEITEAGGPPKLKRILKQLDLNKEQTKKIDEIWERNQKMSEEMWDARQAKHEENFEKIKLILTEEQIQQLDDLKTSYPHKGRRLGKRGKM